LEAREPFAVVVLGIAKGEKRKDELHVRWHFRNVE
jgi:hypothetical protein